MPPGVGSGSSSPICRVLSEAGAQIAPSTHDAAKTRPRSVRALRDAQVKAEIARGFEVNLGIYGARKVWGSCTARGIGCPGCQVERLVAASVDEVGQAVAAQLAQRRVNRGASARRENSGDCPRARGRRRSRSVPHSRLPGSVAMAWPGPAVVLVVEDVGERPCAPIMNWPDDAPRWPCRVGGGPASRGADVIAPPG